MRSGISDVLLRRRRASRWYEDLCYFFIVFNSKSSSTDVFLFYVRWHHAACCEYVPETSCMVMSTDASLKFVFLLCFLFGRRQPGVARGLTWCYAQLLQSNCDAMGGIDLLWCSPSMEARLFLSIEYTPPQRSGVEEWSGKRLNEELLLVRRGIRHARYNESPEPL